MPTVPESVAGALVAVLPKKTLKAEAVSTAPVVVRNSPILGVAACAEVKVTASKLKPSPRRAKLLSAAVGRPVNCSEKTVAVWRVAKVCDVGPLGL